MHRYARHIALPEIGEAGQARLGEAAVLIVGLGGLGCAAAQYLAASGVGQLVLNDFDTVDVSNLQRQVLFDPGDVGELKVASAATSLRRHNPEVRTTAISRRLVEAELIETLHDVDLVLDGSDNFGTRFTVNRACVRARRPLVSGASIRWEGQLAVFDARRGDAPCYRCLFDESDESVEDCAGQGVLAPLVGVIGAAMAIEALKVLLEQHGTSTGKLLRYDAAALSWQESRVSRDPACPVCSGSDAGAA